ncbi:MAG: PDGLE domain-containing protein [Magnetococcus sp. DMHC-1]|nr:PDGLE domain-containing protein [Magnetococcales bacterium]
MHMSDALLSVEVGVGFWLVSGAGIALSSRKVQTHQTQAMVPMMGMLGAFVFAAQMLNFSIPGTGSSGHLAGGILLSILLGGHAAFLVMASVLVVQALLFADGGLLALGANMVNLGIIPCYLVYPLLCRPLLENSSKSDKIKRLRVILATILTAQLGSLGVVLETWLSGRADLPWQPFLLVMQPIQLVMGTLEGFITVAVLRFLHHARTEWQGNFQSAQIGKAVHAGMESGIRNRKERPRLPLVAGLALLCATVLPWYASTKPDGLEFSIARLSAATGLRQSPGIVHQDLAQLQHRLALMPKYELKQPDLQAGPHQPGETPHPAGPQQPGETPHPAGPQQPGETPNAAKSPAGSRHPESRSLDIQANQNRPWGTPDAEKSLAGLLGGIVTLGLLLGVGWLSAPRRRSATADPTHE